MEKIMSIGELKVAYADGAKIQFKMDGKGWVDLEEPVFDCPASYYRVKSHFRPFKDVAELTATWEKMMGMKVRPNTMPLIWVKSEGIAEFIASFDEDGEISLSYHTSSKSLERMLNDVTFLDGTPFGVKEEA
jgi:hypothetical protein